MKVLLDTQAFLWLIGDCLEASKKSRELFLNDKSDLYLSSASLWEIAIKHSIGKLTLKQPLEQFLTIQLQENAIQLLDIHFRHIVKVASLPFYHRDPFDRLIISQSLIEKIPIVSCDVAFDEYGVKRLW